MDELDLDKLTLGQLLKDWPEESLDDFDGFISDNDLQLTRPKRGRPRRRAPKVKPDRVADKD